MIKNPLTPKQLADFQKYLKHFIRRIDPDGGNSAICFFGDGWDFMEDGEFGDGAVTLSKLTKELDQYAKSNEEED